MEHKCQKEEIIARINKTLDGNGQPGMKDTVARIDQNLDNLDRRMSEGFESINKRLDAKEQKGQFNVTTLIAIGSLVIAIIAIIYKT
jgi:hypothetical protein